MKPAQRMAPVALTTTLLLVAGSGTAKAATPEDTKQGLARCAELKDDTERLTCFDTLSIAESADPAPVEGKENTTNDNSAGKLIDNSLAAERAIFSFTNSFVTHRPNYILPVSWVNEPNPDPTSPRLGQAGYDYFLENEEAKYQISFKLPLLTGLFDDDTTLWFGYTQKSFWQVYNQNESAPFRETNYEPEIFFRHKLDWQLGPGTLNGVTLGFNHQSNGQSEPRSRSWNRIMGSLAYSYDRWLFMVKPWYRIPEKESNDDNADIEKYLGHASYHAVYKLSEDQTLSLKLMNNLRSEDNHTSVEFGYSFPLGDTVKGFVQYYNGYGESLIDYNHRIERVGLGIMINDWL